LGRAFQKGFLFCVGLGNFELVNLLGFLRIARGAIAVALNTPLRIEAREPTRKETVKTRHRRIRKKVLENHEWILSWAR
jgi:hypothetical protein